jgi:predicted RNA-binding Zn-ribbon protein involved in translation (DUF1610 family)
MKTGLVVASLALLVALATSVHVVFASSTNGTIPAASYAWGENFGWINFGCTNCNVQVTDSAVTGDAWSNQYGWINLSPTNGGVTNDGAGNLGGNAWSSGLGWISFSGVVINSSGTFTGTAGTQGSTAGRINFSCSNCGVTTDWRPASVRNQSGNSNNSSGGSTSSSGSFVWNILGFLFGTPTGNGTTTNTPNTVNGLNPSGGRRGILPANGNIGQNPGGIGTLPAYPLATSTYVMSTTSKAHVPSQPLTTAESSRSNPLVPLLLIISGILIIVILILRFIL